MSGMHVFLLVVIAAGPLCALAWWSSGRSRKQVRGSADHEVAKGTGTLQGGTHNPPGSQGFPF
jgi:hypothetical protein